MEQKKILWIVITVSAFLLIIFGTALFLYAPSKSTGPVLQQASSYTSGPAKTTLTYTDADPQSSAERMQLDPDAWVREPEKTPGLDTPIQPTQGNINLTIVTGASTGSQYTAVDVTGLTNGTPATTNSAENTTQMTLNTGAGTNSVGVSQQPQSRPQSDDNNKSQLPVKEGPSTIKATPTARPATARPAATASPKQITVTEYWIQTGSFTNKLNAEKARDSLKSRHLGAEIFTKAVSGTTTYRVRVGPYKSKSEADYWLGTIKEMVGFSASYVSEVKVKK